MVICLFMHKVWACILWIHFSYRCVSEKERVCENKCMCMSEREWEKEREIMYALYVHNCTFQKSTVVEKKMLLRFIHSIFWSVWHTTGAIAMMRVYNIAPQQHGVIRCVDMWYSDPANLALSNVKQKTAKDSSILTSFRKSKCSTSLL